MPLVRALYDYNPYQEDAERSKSVKKGHTFELVKKTNAEWWLVRESAAADPFYIPCSYVEELTGDSVPAASTKKKSTRRTKGENLQRSFEDLLGGDEVVGEPVEDLYAVVKKSSKNSNSADESLAISSTAHEHWASAIDKVTNLVESNGNGEQPKKVKQGSKKKKAKKHISTSPAKEAPGDGDLDNQVVASDDEGRGSRSPLDNTAESLYVNTLVDSSTNDAMPNYANMEDLVQAIFQRPPEPRPVSRPEDVLPPGWEIHVDDQSGRPFYMHKVTKKTSWTVPADRNSQNRKTICFSDSSTLHNQTVNNANKKGSAISKSKTVKGGSTGDDGDANSSRYLRDDSGLDKSVASRIPTVQISPSSRTTGTTGTTGTNASNGSSPLVTTTVTTNTTSISTASSLGTGIGGLRDRLSKPPPLPVLHNLPPMPGEAKRTFPVPATEATTDNKIVESKTQQQLQEWAQNLNRTKVMESGKKCRKNWGVVYIHTDGRFMYFYKQPGIPKSSQKPEAVMDLLNADIRTGTEVEQLSSRKHVLSIKKDGTEYLLNAENAEDLIAWASVLITNMKILKSMSPSELPGENEKTLSLKKQNSSVSSLENVEELSTKKRADVLNAFLPKRKSLKEIKDKNIYKFAPVFGNHLQMLCDREKSLVPKFVTKCIGAVEKKGLNATGLYRISGNLADIQSLRFTINKDEKYEKYDELATSWDVHVLTGALKMFFRELQEPLFTFALFDAFLKTMEERDDKVRSKQERDLIERLPAANKETTKVLFRHMANVVAHRTENQMSNHSIAVVFGPTLLWPESSTSLELGTLLVCQGRVVENLLSDMANVF